MLFKVYAGSIYCGVLLVYPSSGEHQFIDVGCNKQCSFGAVDKVARYKKLRLVREL